MLNNVVFLFLSLTLEVMRIFKFALRLLEVMALKAPLESMIYSLGESYLYQI